MRVSLLLLFTFVIVTLIVSFTVSDVYAWDFGYFSAEDYFLYDVCDYITLDSYTAVSSKCYELEMTVLHSVLMDSGNVWIIHVTFDGKNDIILVDDSFKIKSIYHKYISTSLHNTVFWLYHHAKIYLFEPVIGK